MKNNISMFITNRIYWSYGSERECLVDNIYFEAQEIKDLSGCINKCYHK